jgi:RNA polymerase sigma-70 factor (ECF subfamily)
MDRKIPITIDRTSFRVMYDLYYEPICRFLNYYTRDRFAIEDVVQEVFIKLWEDRFFLEIQHIKSYLYSAARNKMLNYLRNSINHAAILKQWSKEEIETIQTSGCYDLDEFSVLLYSAIETLPQKCRNIFIQSKWGKLSYKQIAEVNNISTKTVETQMSIALKRIREYISNHFKTMMISGIFFSSFFK